MDVLIRPMQPSDWDRVSAIYKQGIDLGSATFEIAVPGYEKWDREHRKRCRFVAESGGTVIGWVALSPVSGRCVFSGVSEVSIYIDESHRNRGVGKKLLSTLITEAEQHGMWTLQSMVLEHNKHSIGLHQRCGFRIVGIREHIGKDRDGIWRSSVLMEYRSKTVGND